MHNPDPNMPSRHDLHLKPMHFPPNFLPCLYDLDGPILHICSQLYLHLRYILLERFSLRVTVPTLPLSPGMEE